MTRYFYTSEQMQDDNTVILIDEDAHHLLRVLRAEAGDKVELCNERGQCHLSSIVSLDKHQVSCSLVEPLPDHEAAIHFTLAFGLLKGEKTEFILQKATELGISSFLPFVSERTVVRPEKTKGTARLMRWEKIVRGAAGQSRRNLIPKIHEPTTWQELVKQVSNYDKAVLFWEAEHKNTLTAVLGGTLPGSRVLLVTGPEGGFSENEAQRAMTHGMVAVTLGPRILRAETAALTALAVSMYEVGEMGG
jgi:16S rRNA (uracil1498-N3)-methyltransferase